MMWMKKSWNLRRFWKIWHTSAALSSSSQLDAKSMHNGEIATLKDWPCRPCWVSNRVGSIQKPCVFPTAFVTFRDKVNAQLRQQDTGMFTLKIWERFWCLRKHLGYRSSSLFGDCLVHFKVNKHVFLSCQAYYICTGYRTHKYARLPLRCPGKVKKDNDDEYCTCGNPLKLLTKEESRKATRFIQKVFVFLRWTHRETWATSLQNTEVLKSS